MTFRAEEVRKLPEDSTRRAAKEAATRKSKFTEGQIARAPREAETGVLVVDICRKLGISELTFYVWRKKYGAMGVAGVRRTKQLEDENRRMKQLVADLTLDKQMLQEVLTKNGEARSPSSSRETPGGLS